MSRFRKRLTCSARPPMPGACSMRSTHLSTAKALSGRSSLSVDLTFASQAWEDYLFWQRTDPRTLARIHELIKDIKRNPYGGIGKPEPLKHGLQGYWSRRITSEHRI